MSNPRHQNITTKEDYEELRKAYQFLPTTTVQHDDDDLRQEGRPSTTWQERMVERYHSHLYKSHVMADLSLYKVGKIGLRWR